LKRFERGDGREGRATAVSGDMTTNLPGGRASRSDGREAWRVLWHHYLEMPGLSLTVQEAARLVGLPAHVTAAAFAELEQRRFLARTRERYHRPSA
jgi:hypothetical protein